MEDSQLKPALPGIVFMGTPEFAVASLRAIHKAGYPVKGVVTSCDKPSGRGLKMHISPVKEYALEHKLPLAQPQKLKDPSFLELLRSWDADIFVVVAFRMLPEEVWAMPPLGTFNLHASLLPQYRGAAPINSAVMHGEKKTGVTTFFINHEIDQGRIIKYRETPIAHHETAGDVHDRLMQIGSELVVETIDAIQCGGIKGIDQQSIYPTGILKTAPKLFRQDCRIDWNKDAESLYHFIRGLSPFPSAWTEIVTEQGEAANVKIFFVAHTDKQVPGSPGGLLTDNKSYLTVITGRGTLQIERLQIQGKKVMPVADFLRGFTNLDQCRFR
jgi:methionyl-tRNA formyltransferase